MSRMSKHFDQFLATGKFYKTMAKMSEIEGSNLDQTIYDISTKYKHNFLWFRIEHFLNY